MSEALITAPELPADGRNRDWTTRPLVPRSFSDKSWRNFRLENERKYLAMVPGEPTVRQRTVIEALIVLEFNAYKRSKEARQLSGREAREAAREARQDWSEFHKRLADFERSLAPKAPPASKAKPGPPQLTLEQHLAMLQERREGAA
jgi:hypothetical protein